MTNNRLLAWSKKTAALVPLVPLGVEGGQSAIYAFERDPGMLAGVPVFGEDPKPYFAKINALIEKGLNHPHFAFPLETLVSPKDKVTPVAFSMRRQPGRSLEDLSFKAERKKLGLDWGQAEWRTVAIGLTKLFAASAHLGITQNDTHPGQYLVSWNARTNAPEQVSRVDTLSFGFWHKNTYHGCDKALFEYVPPELQRLGRRKEGLKGFEMPREADWFGLACLLFEVLTGGRHVDYGGGDPDPVKRVEKKEFAVISTPAGARVALEVEANYYGLPTPVTSLFERAFLGDPIKRPTPEEWLKALKAIRPPRRTWFPPQVGDTVPALLAAAARHAGALAKRYAVAAVGAAALVGAVLLLPEGDPRPAGHTPAPVGLVTSGSEATNAPPQATPLPSSPAPDVPREFPPPKRRAKDPFAHEVLNRK